MKISLVVPKEATLKAPIGKPIAFGDALYEIKKTTNASMNVVQALNIDKNNLFQYLNFVIGDPIKQGDVLAQKKGYLKTHKVYSEYTGTISQISHETGEVTVTSVEESNASSEESLVQTAFFKGEISEHDDMTSTITVSLSHAAEIPVKEISADGGGELYYFSDESHYFTASEDQLNERVVVVSELKPHIVAKCEALGCRGFVFVKKGLSTVSSDEIVVDENTFDKLTSSKKKYILYCASEKKAALYE